MAIGVVATRLQLLSFVKSHAAVVEPVPTSPGHAGVVAEPEVQSNKLDTQSQL